LISISRIFLFTAIVLLPFSHFKLIYNFSVSDFFFLVSFIFIFSHQINNSNSLKKLLLDNDFLIPILFYSIGFFISIDTSFNPVDSIFGYFQILFIFIIIYYSFSFHIISEIFLIRLLYILAFISSMITLFILLYFLTNIDYSLNILLVQKGWGASRFSYGLMEPNIAARIAAQSLPILILFSMKGKNLGIKISNSFLTSVVFFSIILTASRTGLIIMIIGILFFFIFYHKYSRKFNLFSLIIYFFIFISLSYIVINTYPDFFDSPFKRYSTILNPSMSDSSKERLLVLDKSLELINENPIIGKGMGNSHNLTGVSLHNPILLSWLENGFIGFIGFTLIYLIIIYYIFAAYNKRFFMSRVLLVLAVISIMMVAGDMFMANSYKRVLWTPAILFIIYFKQLNRRTLIK